LGNPAALMLTPGQAHDLACAEPLIENVDPDALIADKAYDADRFIDTLTARRITPVIPPKANRKTIRPCDYALYCERNLIERFFNQLKHFRAIATRYDKLAQKFSRRRAVGRCSDPAQLKTGPNSYAKISTGRNRDIEAGDFRCLDLSSEPYFISGAYVFQHWGFWEQIRTYLVLGDA
jgi:transposase